MNPKWNPTIKSLVKNLEYIQEKNPAKMNSIPFSYSLGYKWAWNFKNSGWLRIERSRDDGRAHLVWLTEKGEKLLADLKAIRTADHLPCYKCNAPIGRFFRVSNNEWKRVAGDEHDRVICKDCYEKMKVKKK